MHVGSGSSVLLEGVTEREPLLDVEVLGVQVFRERWRGAVAVGEEVGTVLL